MSLTNEDLAQIRNIIESALDVQTKEFINPIHDELEALRNDIKEIYDMIADLQKSSQSEKLFKKLSLEEKILKMHSELIEAAAQAGVKLPSH